MSTEIAVRPTDLSLDAGQTFFTDKQVAALKQLGIKDFTNGDLAVFFHQSVRTGLDPFAKQIYMLARWTKEGTKQTIQTGIDGYRLIARRAADRTHQALSYDDTLWCGHDGQWVDVWLSEAYPAAAKVTIYRGKARYSAVALWREFVQTTKDGSPNAMWSRMSANQLAKCAEAAVLRKAFPQDLSGIYTDDEMGDVEVVDAPPGPAQPPTTTRVSRARKAPEPAPIPEPDLEPEVQPELPDETDEPEELRHITPDQSKKMHTLFTKLKYDRDQGLAFITNLLGFVVESSKELTLHEASSVIDALEAALNG